MKYLFWNTHNNKNINSVLCDLVIENRISIVILAEYDADIMELVELVHSYGVPMKQIPTVGCDRIKMIGEESASVDPATHTDHAAFQVINGNIILCALHLNSQIYKDHKARREIYIQHIVRDMLKLEDDIGVRNTVVVGDFNLDPYEEGCASARFFHGIPFYEEIRGDSRVVAGETFYLFYNPMWNFLGDFKKPYGTYYHGSSDSDNLYWHLFDQVIIRPGLRRRFVDSNLKIITETATRSLLNKQNHPDSNISDHLPITFEIREEEEYEQEN